MLTVAIPTMKRFQFLKESLPIYLAHQAVAEVIVCDETGEDIAEIAKRFQNTKLRLIRNEKRLGIYENKRKAILLATTPYVACLDSDNHFPEEWLDTVSDLLKDSDGNIIASADFKNMDIDNGIVTYPFTQFSGLKISSSSWNKSLENPKLAQLLNEGNWILPLAAAKTLPDIPSDSLQAADAIFMLRCFVKEGFTVSYIPDLSYIHIVHSDSSWLKTVAESSRIYTTTDWRL